jgi:hypothetical protein
MSTTPSRMNATQSLLTTRHALIVMRVALCGSTLGADYEVAEARTCTPEKPRRMKDTELQRYRAVIDDLPGLLLIEYRKMTP